MNTLSNPKLAIVTDKAIIDPAKAYTPKSSTRISLASKTDRVNRIADFVMFAVRFQDMDEILLRASCMGEVYYGPNFTMANLFDSCLGNVCASLF